MMYHLKRSICVYYQSLAQKSGLRVIVSRSWSMNAKRQTSYIVQVAFYNTMKCTCLTMTNQPREDMFGCDRHPR